MGGGVSSILGSIVLEGSDMTGDVSSVSGFPNTDVACALNGSTTSVVSSDDEKPKSYKSICTMR